MPSSQRSGGVIRFSSWNCNGLNQPIKRSKVLGHLRHLGVHIAFLQETHLKPSDHTRLRKRWVGQVYHSSFQSRSRGVAILIHKSVNFTCSDISSDPNGRYVLVSGILNGTQVALLNVYGPNWDDSCFFRSVFSLIPDQSRYHLILGGDFNCWLNPLLDRSSTKTTVLSSSAKVVRSSMDEFALSDPWRFHNPSNKKYSFFSHVHHTFSRIDYFLIDNRLIPLVLSCSYDAIVISDHAPVLMDLQTKGCDNARPSWRLNTGLLSNEDFVTFISQQINFFLEINRTPGISSSLLWETLKAYLRGEIISYCAHESGARGRKLTNLTEQIRQIDDTYSITPSPDLYKERLLRQAEFDVLSTADTEKLLFKSRCAYYEFGDKASKLLAHQLRQKSTSHQIPQIQTPSGITTDPKQINEQFKQFYSSLYAAEPPDDPSTLNNFFDPLDIPTIESGSAEKLEEPITVEELQRAAHAMQAGKCPGPDGYPIEFYRKFFDKLAPILIDVYNESFHSLKLPHTLTQATISLILKKNRDPLSCGSYRPISLLSVDLKLLSKLLAMRLETVLTSIISPDQTGFIQNRYSFFNTRRLLNVMYNPSTSSLPEAVISLDAEKAFDRIEWVYLFHTLKRFGLGDTFISWVRLLYTSPTASVRTNNTYSDYFSLARSTRQGCNLSPLLFAIAIEPLAIALRTSPHITGIKRFGIEQKTSLYADDLLLYISNLSVSIPAALDIFSQFGKISGYKLNLDKSELFPLNSEARNYPLHTLPFKVSTCGFTYLGIRFPDKFADLFKVNFTPLLTNLQNDFARWSLLNLSLSARVNSVKMNCLPKFSYLFQSLPIFLTQSFFQKIDNLVTEFIWNGKVPRLSRRILQSPKSLGGLALPNFKFYYWAANVRILQHWARLENSPSPPAWLVLEASSSSPASLTALAHAPLNFSFSPYSKNAIIKSTLKVWSQFRRHFGLQSFSLLAPIAANPVFPPSVMDRAFSSWSTLGIRTFKELYIGNIFASFEQLSEKYSLSRPHFFRYLQVRNFVRNISPQFPNLPDPVPIDSFLKPVPCTKGMISVLYMLISSLRPNSLQNTKHRWEEDLGEEITEELWDVILRRVHSSSICSRHGLIQCKIVHRTHLTKVRLSKIYGNIDPTCDRCHQAPATHSHMFWSCPSLHGFWSEIFETISNSIDIPIEPTALTALFGVTPTELVLPRYKADLIAFTTLLARRLVLLKWKHPTSPSHSVWLRDILYFIKMEKIRCVIRGSASRFDKTWGPFLNYIEEHHTFDVP